MISQKIPSSTPVVSPPHPLERPTRVDTFELGVSTPKSATPTIASTTIERHQVPRGFSIPTSEILEEHANAADIFRSIARDNQAMWLVGNTYTVLEHASQPISLDDAFRKLVQGQELTLKTAYVMHDYRLKILTEQSRTVTNSAELGAIRVQNPPPNQHAFRSSSGR